MRHPIAAAIVTLTALTGCGSDGPNAPQGATASFSVSARVVPVRCAHANCRPPLGVAIAVRVTEAGGIMGGYVTNLGIVIRDAASGNVLESERYDAAEIASMTSLESNHVYPDAWVEIAPFPFRIAHGDGHTETVSIAVTVTDYHGNEHHQTLDTSID